MVLWTSVKSWKTLKLCYVAMLFSIFWSLLRLLSLFGGSFWLCCFILFYFRSVGFMVAGVIALQVFYTRRFIFAYMYVYFLQTSATYRYFYSTSAFSLLLWLGVRHSQISLTINLKFQNSFSLLENSIACAQISDSRT